MPIDKLLSIIDVAEPTKDNKPIRDIRKENFDASKVLKRPSFKSKNKVIRNIRENYILIKYLGP